MSDERQFCTCTVDGLYLGIAVHHVQEVIRALDMTAVPLAPHAVHGLINLRGQIITAIDLRRRLGVSDRAPGQEPMHVVVRTDDGAVSFLVDEIGDVIETDPATFERAPAMLHADARALVKGVHKLTDRLLLVLDTTLAAQVECAAV